MVNSAGCPFVNQAKQAAGHGQTNKDWWPEKLNLGILRQHSDLVDPWKGSFNYKKAFKELDFNSLKEDLFLVMTTNQNWWPADYGHYGPFFIRMAWHVSGTYRTGDGRAGSSQGLQRFAPTNSWPDNINLDKARRLLWPIKQKYGASISWADLFILAGNCAHESMGLKTFGFGGGRDDIWQPAEDIYWGTEADWLGDNRYFENRKLEKPLAAVQMGLIYVNPEGPNGDPDPKAAAIDIRETFKRMAMNDEETVALIAGGHTFGKCHGAGSASYVGREPNAAPIEEQGLGWVNKFGTGKGRDTIGSGLEGAWTPNPINWDNAYFDMLFGYEWEKKKSPAGAWQWYPKGVSDEHLAPEVDNSDKFVSTIMLTTDLALRFDPSYYKISKYYHHNPDVFADAYAKAWYKLTHRDMGPITRYLGPEVPAEALIWQDPLPKPKFAKLNDRDLEYLKKKLLDCNLSVTEMVKVAWASAFSYRNSDKRGGANGARISLMPQKEWQVNEPAVLKLILDELKNIQDVFNSSCKDNKGVSLADLIVLAGCVAVEKAAQDAGVKITVPFNSGRVDAELQHTDIESFEPLEPEADGFRNFVKERFTVSPEAMLIDKAQLLTLTVPEMTVLVGGLRVLGASFEDKPHGAFTKQLGVLTNDFFVNLLDIQTYWQPIDEECQEFEGYDRESGVMKWQATRVDLIFGHDSELRAVAEVYGCSDAKEKFILDFVQAWVKVLELDRFDLDPDYQD